MKVCFQTRVSENKQEEVTQQEGLITGLGTLFGELASCPCVYDGCLPPPTVHIHASEANWKLIIVHRCLCVCKLSA